MPKYRNKSDIIQPILLQGKRILIKPGQVLETPMELQLQFFENLARVPDNTPSTPISEMNIGALVPGLNDKPQVKHSIPPKQQPQQVPPRPQQAPVQQQIPQPIQPGAKQIPKSPFVKEQQQGFVPASKQDIDELKAQIDILNKRLEIIKNIMQSMDSGIQSVIGATKVDEHKEG